LVLRPQFFKS